MAKQNKSIDYGVLTVDNWKQTISSNSYFYLNGKKYQCKQAEILLIKRPNNKVFKIWFKNQLFTSDASDYDFFEKEWNLFTQAVED